MKILLSLVFLTTISQYAFAGCPRELFVTVKCESNWQYSQTKDRNVKLSKYTSTFDLVEESKAVSYNDNASFDATCEYEAQTIFPVEFIVKGERTIVNNHQEMLSLMLKNEPSMDPNFLRDRIFTTDVRHTGLKLSHVKAFLGISNTKYKADIFNVGMLVGVTKSKDWIKLDNKTPFVTSNGADIAIGVTSLNTPNGNGGLNQTQIHVKTLRVADVCYTTIQE